MTQNTEALFSPFTSEKLSLKNRVVMAPMTRSFSPGNVPNDLNVEYYKTRAANGVGLIITEGTCVGHKAANGYPNVPYIYGKDSLDGWKRVVDAVHEAGGKIAPQLWHVGAVRKPGTEPDPDVPGYSPSGMMMPGKVTGHAMTKDDIADVIQAFATAAKDAKDIGFDAIELHGAHGYLIDQFFWEGTNQRDDEYGGSLENRLRFGVEIIKAVRKAVGDDFPIILRFSQWKMQDYSAKLGNTPAELEAFLMPLVEAGVDIFHCSTRRFWEPEFEGSDLNLAGWTQKITGKPAITVGSVTLNQSFIDEDKSGFSAGAETTDLSELTLRMDAGEFDLAAVGRALIANPDWAVKVQSGKVDELVPYGSEMLKNLT